METDSEHGREAVSPVNHDADPIVSDGRRDFLKGVLAAGGAAVSLGKAAVPLAQAQPGMVPGTTNHYYVPATDKTVHWGYFSKLLKPLAKVSPVHRLVGGRHVIVIRGAGNHAWLRLGQRHRGFSQRHRRTAGREHALEEVPASVAYNGVGVMV